MSEILRHERWRVHDRSAYVRDQIAQVEAVYYRAGQRRPHYAGVMTNDLATVYWLCRYGFFMIMVYVYIYEDEWYASIGQGPLEAVQDASGTYTTCN